MGLLVLVTIAGLLAFALAPWLPAFLGINRSGAWFLDSYAVLAAGDAVRTGFDPHLPNPLDILQRPHVYGDGWLWLGKLGLTRAHNFAVGGMWVAAFLLFAWLTLRPRDTTEALLGALVLLSPACLLAINRANNDLVIFAFLGAGTLGLRSRAGRGWPLALPPIALATALKFYPAAAVAMFLPIRPARTRVLACLLGLLVAGLVLCGVWPQLAHGRIPIPPMLHTFGSAVLLRDLGVTGPFAAIIGIAIVAAAGYGFARRGWTRGLCSPAGDLPRQGLFALGSALLLACFLAGLNYSYRLIFAVWLLPWLVDEMRGGGGTDRAQRTARITTVLLMANLWADGLFCGFTNFFAGEMSLAAYRAWERGWRLLSQPLVWIWSSLLAGWLIELTVTAMRLEDRPIPLGPANAAQTATVRRR